MNKIVIIDTGVDINSTYIRKYVKDIVGIKVKKNGETFDVVSTSTDPTCINDTVGHGTAITGIILSHNPNVSIFFVKIFEAGELVADEDTLIFALDYVYNNIDFDILNLSLGICSVSSNDKLNSICKKYHSNGKYIVSAFDNNGAISFPAAYEQVIGVTSDNHIYNNNDYYVVDSKQVNICAKGQKQRVYWLNSAQIFSSGNSFACAHFTGIMSCFPDDLCKSDLWKCITKNATKCIDGSFNNSNKHFLQGPVANYNKIVAFPFSKEIHSLIRFQEKLCFELVDIYDTKYSARIGASTNRLLKESGIKNHFIKSINEIDWDSFDTMVLGHLDKIIELVGDKYVCNLICEIIIHDKNIYSFDDISQYCLHGNVEKIYYPCVSKINCERVPFGKLYRQDKPVLGIFGTSSKQGKFTLQLKLRYELLERGYKLFQLGTEPSALLYGMNAVYPVGYNSTVSISGVESIAHINKVMYEQSRDADLIIVGGQAGVLPLDEGNLNCYNYAAIDLLYATLPDAIILCINPSDEISFIKRTIGFVESIANCKVIALAVYPFYYAQSDIMQQNLLKMSRDVYMGLYEKKFAPHFTIPVILPNNNSDIHDLCNLIEDYFCE
ncbi:MAG: DUF1611 domain-containing protein [Clostridiales bacterium]|nr:DUF1611 domain-containing protein [Clostridiales bacterium]PWM22693.1 MAG: hypothetical protein DBX53_03485 [Clostridiales bacterium]